MQVLEYIDGVVEARYNEFRDRISREDWLSGEDIVFLQEQHKDGCPEARKIAIENVMKLAYKIAGRYGMFDNPQDLAHESVFGIARAFDKYDPAKGKFSTYVTPWINQCIRRHLEKDKDIRIPSYLFYDAGKVSSYLIEYSEGRKIPCDEKIAESTGVKLDRVKRIMKLPKTDTVSLNIRIKDDGDELLYFQEDKLVTPPDFKGFNYEALFSVLSPQQRKSVFYRHGFDNGGHLRTFQEVAGMIEAQGKNGSGRNTICKTRAKQLYDSGTEKIRELISAEEAI